MMTTTGQPLTGARKPALPRGVAMQLALHEYELISSQMHTLSEEDWVKPTACAAWNVHAMACHVVGMAEFAASVPEQIRQTVQARRAGGLFIDALTDLQVNKHVASPPAQVARRMSEVAPRAARGRRRTPSLLRRLPMTGQPVDNQGHETETWSLGYLTDVILTRDTWMHRSDIALATGRPMALTPEHDGTLVADVATEWASRHGAPCTLHLTGPAGGAWTFNGANDDSPDYELDAVEFCRIVSGRGIGSGLLATRVPF